MSRFVEVIDLPLSPIAASESLAAFERAAEWDPGVFAATRLDPRAPRGAGTRFEGVVGLLGRRVPLASRAGG